MALCSRSMKTYCVFLLFMYWLPCVFFLLFQCTAGLALRHMAQQQHTVLAAATHTSASASDVTGTTSASAFLAEDGPQSQNSWLCRISRGFDACGSRDYSGVYPPLKNTYCPDKFCCSKTACLGGCGSWCHDSWALCSSSVVYHPEWSYGNCNCKRFGHQCDQNAECVHLNEASGGVYCKCRTGFLGDGKSCTTDFCAGNPCNPGECTNVEGGYSCTCPDTHMLQTTNNKESCKEKPDYCLAEPCGPAHMVEECKNTGEGYECTCRQGYTVRHNRCEEVDLCANSPCGAAEAVHSCVTEREPKFRYRCQCKAGYDLRFMPDGQSEICKKNWCYGDPCGDQDRVVSCNSTNDGYSCLCKDTYVVQTDTEGREKCVKDDVCKQAPCGTPDIAKKCYAEGSGYRCECQPGYVEFTRDGRLTCVEGDACLLEACGSPEKVAECRTSGSNYTCTCREPDYLLGLENGKKTCLSKQECADNCGPLEAVQTCEISKGVYSCKCNSGYLTVYRDGKRMCEEQDLCAVAPCGPEEAVEKCTPNPSGSVTPYTCTCKAGYEVRTLEDDSEVCAKVGSCVGNPCGPAEIVKACITEHDTYSCQCAEHYVEITVGGAKRCASAADTERSEEIPKSESQGMSNTAIAGTVVGGIVLLGCVGAGIAYSRKENEEEEDGSAGGGEGEQPGGPPLPSNAPGGPGPVYMGPPPGI